MPTIAKGKAPFGRGESAPEVSIGFRLQRGIARHGSNPLMPFFIELLDRHLSGASARSLGAQMLSPRLSRRNLPKERLRELVAAYRELPSPLLDRVASPNVRAAGRSFAEKLYTDSAGPIAVREGRFTREAQLFQNALPGISRHNIVANPVFLLTVNPQSDTYARGQQIELKGRFFTDAGPTRVVFEFQRGGEFPLQERFEATPSQVSAQTVNVTIPGGVAFHRTYDCYVEWPARDEEPRQTNVRQVTIGPDPNAPKPLNPPVIKDIAPGRHPGEKILINGAQFDAPPGDPKQEDPVLMGDRLSVTFVFQDDVDPSLEHHDWELGAPHVVRLNDHQLEVKLPWRMVPGRYRVAVTQWGGLTVGGGGTSDWITYDVVPWRFQVTADSIEVLDETDGFGGSEGGEDEIFAAWVVAVDGTHNLGTISKTYDLEEDRDENLFLQSFTGTDRNLLGPGNSALPVTRALGIGLYLYESNSADVQSMQSVLGALSDVADAVAGVSKAAGAPLVQAVAMLVSAVLDLFSLIVGALEGDPIEIGRPHTSEKAHGMAWDVSKLQFGTRKGAQRFSKVFDFDGDDAHGHYRTKVIISRTT